MSDAATVGATDARPGSDLARDIVGRYGLLIVYAALFLFFSIKRTDSFLQVDTWTRTILSPTGFTPRNRPGSPRRCGHILPALV